MFTQISATLQTDITNIVSQLEKVNLTQASSGETKQEDVNVTQQIVNPVEEVQQVVVETANAVQSTENVLQDLDAPKNEL
jgi:hypothetical protein